MFKLCGMGFELEYTEFFEVAKKHFDSGGDVFKMKLDEVVPTSDIPNIIFKWVKVYPEVTWKDY